MQLRNWLLYGALAGCVAGCGGGSGPIALPAPTSAPTTAPTTAPTAAPTASPATYVMSDPTLVQFAGDVRKLSVADAAGNPATPASWTSAAGGIATVDASGNVTAVAPGSTTITAIMPNGKAQSSITVTGAPQTIQDVYEHFPLGYSNGPVALYSDISPSFTAINGAGLTMVWNYFARTFAKSYNGHALVYYTQDAQLYAKAYNLCHGAGSTPPGTQNTSYVDACYDAASGTEALVMMPTTFPNDWPRMQDEVGHQFLYATYPQSLANTWAYEGLGMSWNGGSFDASGNLVWGPVPAYVTIFKQAYAAGATVPLDTLVNLDESTFYGSLFSATSGVTQTAIYFSQSMMFVCYLYAQHRSAVDGLIAQWNSGAISNNAQTLAYIQAQTGMSLSQLDAAYTAYAMSY